MVSFKTFKQNKFLMLENRYIDNYWFKVSYENFISLLNTNIISIDKSLFLVTLNSERAKIYKDEYKFPITIYCNKEKIIKYLEDHNYQSSLDKETEFFKEDQEPTNSDNPEEEFNPSSFYDESPSEEQPEESEELDSSQESAQEFDTPEEAPPPEELPEEISINEDHIEFDPDIIDGIEISFKKMENLLDKEFNNIIKLLKLSTKFNNIIDNDKRLLLIEIFKDMTTNFCTTHNITKNYIEN